MDKVYLVWSIGYYDEDDSIDRIYSSLEPAVDWVCQFMGSKKHIKEFRNNPLGYSRYSHMWIEERKLDG